MCDFAADKQAESFSQAAILLLKGIVSRGRDESLWQTIINQQGALEDYFHRIGLSLIVDEVDEYAYLKQEETGSLPRIVPRHQLSFPVSMLLVQLRKALGEQDTASSDTHLVLTFGDILRRMEPFLPVSSNEMKLRQSVEHMISQVVNLGFLQKSKGQEDTYEVRPILRNFVDAQWLNDFHEKLAAYTAYGEKQHGGGENAAEETAEEVLISEFVRDE